MISKTIKGDSTEDLIKEFDKATSDDFKPTLAIVFLSIKQDCKAISSLLDKEGIDVFGSTPSGAFIDGTIEEAKERFEKVLDTAIEVRFYRTYEFEALLKSAESEEEMEEIFNKVRIE